MRFNRTSIHRHPGGRPRAGEQGMHPPSRLRRPDRGQSRSGDGSSVGEGGGHGRSGGTPAAGRSWPITCFMCYYTWPPFSRRGCYGHGFHAVIVIGGDGEVRGWFPLLGLVPCCGWWKDEPDGESKAGCGGAGERCCGREGEFVIGCNFCGRLDS